MRKSVNLAVLVGLLAVVGVSLTGCVEGDRALSAMDTYWLTGNTHDHLVLKDGSVVYSQ